MIRKAIIIFMNIVLMTFIKIMLLLKEFRCASDGRLAVRMVQLA